MENKVKNVIINKVTTLLYKKFKNHQTIVLWGGDDWRWKKVYLKNVSVSLVNYALYGKCMMAPERQYDYLKWLAKDYQEPKVKYNVFFAIDVNSERDIKDMESILMKQLHDNEIDVRETINEIIQIIVSVCSQKSMSTKAM